MKTVTTLERYPKIANYIKSKGFTHLKFELEADLDRDVEDDYCRAYILENISDQARKALTYSKFYNDGSVDSEFTFTYPVEKAHYATEVIEAFKALSRRIGNGINIENAGFHIAVLRTGYYPCSKTLSAQKTNNFCTSMTKLLPALFFFSTHNYNSRPLEYRGARIGGNKYSAIHVCLEFGFMEYRVFEPCFDCPSVVLDKIAVIAKSLKYYSATPLKRERYTQFDVINQHEGAIGRSFETAEALKTLARTAPSLMPNGTTLARELKKRSIKPQNCAKRSHKLAIELAAGLSPDISSKKVYESLKIKAASRVYYKKASFKVGDMVTIKKDVAGAASKWINAIEKAGYQIGGLGQSHDWQTQAGKKLKICEIYQPRENYRVGQYGPIYRFSPFGDWFYECSFEEFKMPKLAPPAKITVAQVKAEKARMAKVAQKDYSRHTKTVADLQRLKLDQKGASYSTLGRSQPRFAVDLDSDYPTF